MHSHKNALCRDFVFNKQLVTPNIPIPDIKNNVIDLRVTSLDALNTILSMPMLTTIGIKSNSFLNSLKAIHSGIFQKSTRSNGAKQAVRIETLFNGYGQNCTAAVEKKIINTVDRQYEKKAALPHISQFKYLMYLLLFMQNVCTYEFKL
jgi:hypothetical protein